ncbi:MAG TPA: hypothetical protein VNW72_07530 [Chthoniobacterales bacterium]|nr:hypothetical protein [Chthoniobacterales bacterium]
MTLFELTFTLSALILGLALTHMASSLYRLVLAGRRVRWALEPLMQAALVLLIVVFVWLNEWNGRGVTTIIYGRVLLRSLNLLVLYIAAAVCLPEAREGAGEVNMHAYYDRARRLSFGALAIGLVFFNLYNWTGEQSFHWRWQMLRGLTFLPPYVVMMFVRWRWLNVSLLAAMLIYFSIITMGYRLSG